MKASIKEIQSKVPWVLDKADIEIIEAHKDEPIEKIVKYLRLNAQNPSSYRWELARERDRAAAMKVSEFLTNIKK